MSPRGRRSPNRPARLHVTAIQEDSGDLLLDGEQAHYVRNVLRLGVGDSLLLFDGSGWEYPAAVSTASPQAVSLRVSAPRRGIQEPPVRVSLGACLLKAQKMDLVVQKSVELGVHEVIPVLSSRSVRTLEGERVGKRLQRWRKIAQEASRQCGRSRVPEVGAVVTLAELLERGVPADLKILFTTTGAPWPARVPGQGAGPPEQILALTGPEGGFSGEEETLALDAGFSPVRLGPRTLRAETAAILAVGLLQYAFGDLGPRVPGENP